MDFCLLFVAAFILLEKYRTRLPLIVCRLKVYF